MVVEVFMPKMSDHMEVGEIVEWLVPEGAMVEKGQPILVIMTDKATVELESPASGVLRGVRIGVVPGASIPVGETIAFITAEGESVPVLPGFGGETSTAGPAETASQAGLLQAPSSTVQNGTAETGPVRTSPFVRKLAKELGVALEQVRGSGQGGRVTEQDVRAFAEGAKAPAAPPALAPAPASETVIGAASPLAARVAKEMGVDLTQVRGSGPDGRITKEDVQAFADAQKIQGMPPGATVSVSAPTAVPSSPPAPAQQADLTQEWLELTPIQRLTGQRMLQSIQNAPQFALSIDVDMTAALALRQSLMDVILAETGEHPSITAVLVRVVASALRDMPRANASFESGRLKLHPQVNIGIAVGTEAGLAVPVIKEADRKSMSQITCELKTFQEKASSMRFNPEDLSGSTFTISNLGMYGIERFNAIVNPPESAILAVGSIVKKPVGMPDDSIALRPMMNLTLSIDHRVLDGVAAAKFLAKIKARLEQPYLLL
jgi:pyruvate dehydrogenase E2 component (dihydrolipoamide acetyltransferase)